MNTILKPILFLILVLAISCSEPTSDIQTEETAIAEYNLQANKRVGVTNVKPFKASFFTIGGNIPGQKSVDNCGEPPLFYNVQEGSGQATHLGNFDTYITFCVDATDILDGVLSEGESIPYFSNENTENYMVAANGDMLFAGNVEGVILPSDKEGFDFMFMDSFEFSGGTGRFEGAIGSGMTVSYVIAALGKTEHEWTGTLTIQK